MAEPALSYDALADDVGEALRSIDAIVTTVTDRVDQYTTRKSAIQKLKWMQAEYLKQESFLHAWVTARAILRLENDERDSDG